MSDRREMLKPRDAEDQVGDLVDAVEDLVKAAQAIRPVFNISVPPAEVRAGDVILPPMPQERRVRAPLRFQMHFTRDIHGDIASPVELVEVREGREE